MCEHLRAPRPAGLNADVRNRCCLLQECKELLRCLRLRLQRQCGGP